MSVAAGTSRIWNVNVKAGQEAVLAYPSRGMGYQYRWYKNGVLVPGQTSYIFRYVASAADDGSQFIGVAGTDATRASVLAVTPKAWSSAETIISLPGGTLGIEPKLAVSRTGEAAAVWSQASGLWLATFRPGSGWQTPQRIADATSEYALAIDDAGAYFRIVWIADSKLWFQDYRPLSGLGAARQLQDLAGTTPAMLKLSTDVDSFASVVTWVGADLAGKRVLWLGSVASAGAGLAKSQVTTEYTDSYELVRRRNGSDFVIAWTQVSGTTSSSLRTRVVSSSGTPKGSESIITSSNTESERGLPITLAMDRNEKAWLGYTRKDGARLVTSEDLTGWSTPVEVASAAVACAGKMRLDAWPDGRVAAGWYQVSSQANAGGNCELALRINRPGTGWAATNLGGSSWSLVSPNGGNSRPLFMVAPASEAPQLICFYSDGGHGALMFHRVGSDDKLGLLFPLQVKISWQEWLDTIYIGGPKGVDVQFDVTAQNGVAVWFDTTYTGSPNPIVSIKASRYF